MTEGVHGTVRNCKEATLETFGGPCTLPDMTTMILCLEKRKINVGYNSVWSYSWYEEDEIEELGSGQGQSIRDQMVRENYVVRHPNHPSRFINLPTMYVLKSMCASTLLGPLPYPLFAKLLSDGWAKQTNVIHNITE